MSETPVSVAELILKAELSLAALEVSRNDLSMRVADTLLLGARVRLDCLASAAQD